MAMRWFKKRSSEPKSPKQQPQPAQAAATTEASTDPATRNRQRVAAADSAVQAAAVIAELSPPMEERIALYLARRDLVEAMFADPALDGEAALIAIEHQSRNHNKAANRNARERLKQLRSARKQADAVRQRVSELIESASRINAGSALTERDLTARALIDEQWQALSQKWPELAQRSGETDAQLAPLPELNPALPRLTSEPEEIEADVESANADSEAAQAQQAAAEQLQKQQQQQEQAAAQALQEAQTRLESRQSAITQLLGAVATDADASSPGDARKSCRAQRKQIHKLIQALDWPKDAEAPAELGQLNTASEALDQQLKRLDQACTDERERLEKSISDLNDHLDQGSTRAAGTLHGQIRRAHPELYDLSKSAHQALNQASAKLRQFGAWQQFATSPKRQALCDAMRQAAEAPLEPKLQAERIKELRADWLALGPVREEADRQALKAFDSAAEAAFEPCRAYYAEQAQEREQNAAARSQICEQLQSYLDSTDWRSADFDAAEKILHQARASWRTHFPVPRKLEADLSAQFESLQEALHDKLKAHWNANADAKQALIDQALALLQDTDKPLPERIEQTKTLQSRWKSIGRVPRKRDQALWQAFRAACDGLFAERDAQSAAHNARLDGARNAAQTLLSEFEATVVETSASEANQGALKTFRGALRDVLAPLPGPAQRDLDGQARKLMERYQGLLREQGHATLRLELERFQHWDAAYAASPEQPPADVPSNLFGAQSAAEEALQRMAIGAEMAADLPSPESDQALRMAMKVEQLQQSLGSQSSDQGDDLIAQAKAWCALGCKTDDAASAALRERFFKALLTTAR